MKTIILEGLVDKSDWGEGPWTDEPDKKQWEDKATGLACLAVRNRFGVWCGYVGVPSGHPLYEEGYMDSDEVDSLAVYGGVTFGGHCVEEGSEPRICHTPEAGEPDDVWWIGFDCCHHADFSPGLRYPHPEAMFSNESAVYRTLGYVEQQCAELAAQIAEVGEQKP